MREFVELDCIEGKRKKYIYTRFIPLDNILEIVFGLSSRESQDYVLYFKTPNGCSWQEITEEDKPDYRIDNVCITRESYEKVKKLLENSEGENEDRTRN
jgi:hypothetical protein